MNRKKILSLIIIAAIVLPCISAGAVNNPEFVGNAQVVADTLDNFDRTWEYDGPLKVTLDETTPDDMAVAHRTYAAPAYLIYKSERPITGFYISMMVTSNSGVEVLMSKDGEEWTQISHKLIGTAPWKINWTWNYIVQDENIPITEDYRYLKVNYIGEGSGYSPRVSHVEYYCDGITSQDDIVEANVPTPLELSPYKREARLFINDGSMTEEGIDKKITRGEFADIVAKVNRLGGIGIEESFTDVFSSSPYYNSINALKANGIMNGFTDGSFRPDNYLTYEQAAMVLVKMLGYGITLKDTDSALGKAVELGLYRRIDQSKPLTKDVAAGMLWNAVLCKRLTVESISTGEGELITKTDSAFLEEVMGIVEFEGLITATKMGRISGVKPQTGNIAIDLNEFEGCDEAIHNYLGYTVKYYRYDDPDNKKIISYTPEEKTKALTIEGRSIESVTENKLVYTDEDGNRQNKSLKLKFICENGMRNYAGNHLTVQAMQGKDGFITFTDTDYDNSYDTALITEFKTYVLGDRNSKTKCISDKFSSEMLCLDQEEKEDLVLVFKGSFADFSAVKKDNVLSVAKSSDYEVVYVTARKVSGSISEFDDDKFTIGKEQYKLTFDFVNKAKSGKEGYSEVVLGYAGDFYLDKMGNIAYATFNISDRKYAFLIDAGIKGNLAGTLQLKLYDGKQIKIYDVGDSLAVSDGVTSKKYAAKEALSKLKGANESVEQLLLVKYGDGDTIERVQMAKSGNDAMEFSLDYQSIESEIGSNNIVDLKYALSRDDTKVFVIPYDRDDEKGYSTSVSLVGKESYSIDMYDINSLNVPDVAVVFTGKNYGSKADLNYSNVAVVDRLYYITNQESGETLPQLDVVTGDGEKSYRISDKFTGVQNSNSIAISSLKKGDVIRTGANNRGDVIKIELIYSIEDNLHKGATTIASQNYTAVGTLKKSDGVYFLVAIDGDSEEERILYGSQLKVVVVDKKNDTVEAGTITDVHDGDRIVLYNYRATVKNIVVIRE